ncbi:c-type cytochrome [Acidovorax sp.]|uniref:c-type cytochrome n=1 Tax=Acidovorax sp. TaxID=1872122 RepID=UPI0025BE15BF|nr:c-type cytochrome [Acidovorax sp.]
MSGRLIQSLALSAACLLAGTVFAQSVPASHDMAARVAACTTCHGREGRATNSEYFPRLAGKPAGYLFEQLRNFRDGRRQQTYMNGLLANMSDAYLHDIAEYFASLDYPYSPPPASSAPSLQLARGKTLVFSGDPARGIPACASCHGEALTGVLPSVPSLLGLPRAYVAAQLGAWVTGQRRAIAPDCMAEVGRKLNSEDVHAVVSWLEIQPVPVSNKPVASLPTRPAMPCSAMETHP